MCLAKVGRGTPESTLWRRRISRFCLRTFLSAHSSCIEFSFLFNNPLGLKFERKIDTRRSRKVNTSHPQGWSCCVFVIELFNNPRGLKWHNEGGSCERAFGKAEGQKRRIKTACLYECFGLYVVSFSASSVRITCRS